VTDRITYDAPDTDRVDEIMVADCDVHIEMLDDSAAYFHLTRDGKQVRGDITATRNTRRRPALRITVEDDEIGLTDD